MRRQIAVALLSLVLTAGAAPVAAQADRILSPIGPGPSPLWAAAAVPARVDRPVPAPPVRWPAASAAPRRSYWGEGAVIGAVMVGLAAGALSHGLCSMDSGRSCIGAAAGGAMLGIGVGGTVGALLGGLVSRDEAKDRAKAQETPGR